MAQALPFGEWLDVVAERMAKKREKEEEEKAAREAKAAERQKLAEIQFSAWAVDKAVHDKALEVSRSVELGVQRTPGSPRGRARAGNERPVLLNVSSPSSPLPPFPQSQLLPQVGIHRASEEGQWKEVGVCLAYVDICIREKHKALHAEISMNPKRSLEYMFMNWSRKNHAFDTVRTGRGSHNRGQE
jgi:hypothetical protein